MVSLYGKKANRDQTYYKSSYNSPHFMAIHTLKTTNVSFMTGQEENQSI